MASRASWPTPEVEIVYLRPPDNIQVYHQELLFDGSDTKITLQVRTAQDGDSEFAEGVRLVPGSILLWYSSPTQHCEIGAFHDPAGTLLGFYGNIVAPSQLDGPTWRIKDLFLDVWQPVSGRPQVLDEAEFELAVEMGWLTPEEAHQARRESEAIVRRIVRRRWPPRQVRRWTLEDVPVLRLRRDAPGTYYAALVSGRLIAFGLYWFGTAALTSIGFAALTTAFVAAGTAQQVWLVTLAVEGLVLLPLVFAGRLPATRWPEPALTDERTLFIGALAAGLALLAMNQADGVRPLLAGLYGALTVFLSIFAFSRAYFDRTFPVFAAAGLVVSLAALFILL